jgi:hypothetical protein
MMWGILLSGALNLAKDFIQGRVEEAKIKKDIRLKALENEGAWEAIMAQGTHTSWKDEFFTIILSIPIILVGYAVAMDEMDIIARLHDSFIALEALPDWYSYLLFLAVSASFGVRSVDKLMNLKGKK